MSVFPHVVAPVITGGNPVDIAKTYAVNEAFLINIPATGTFVDVNSTVVANDSSAFFVVPGGGVSGIADSANPTLAEIALLDVVDGPTKGSTTNLNFRYITESVDSGAATEQGATWIDGVTWPPGEPNDLLLWNENIGAFKKYDVYRCIRTNIGVASAWEKWTAAELVNPVILPSGYEVVKYTGTMPGVNNGNIAITVPAGKVVVDYKLLVNYTAIGWLNPAYYTGNASYGGQLLVNDSIPSISFNSMGTVLLNKPYRLLVTFAN